MIYVIYGATHNRCNRLLLKSDNRVKDAEGLRRIQNDFHPLKIFCTNCMEDAEPTTVGVYLSEGLSMKPVDKFAGLRIPTVTGS